MSDIFIFYLHFTSFYILKLVFYLMREYKHDKIFAERARWYVLKYILTVFPCEI